MFAQSSWYLANLENLQVIKLISQVYMNFLTDQILLLFFSVLQVYIICIFIIIMALQVIKDFASGEIKQASSLFNCDVNSRRLSSIELLQECISNCRKHEICCYI